MPPEEPAIVVIGGTGATGREIVAALGRTLPAARIAVAARRPVAGMPTVILDVEAPSAEAMQQLRGFDLAVLALGPFHAVRDRAHRLCIEAGLDCVDVLDCPATARDVLALGGAAHGQGVRVLTGMGLNPGLSTLLLDLLLGCGFQPPQRIRVRLFAGGDEPAGYAATRMMLHQFQPMVEGFCQGRAVDVAAVDEGDEATYRFPGLDAPVAAIHCTSAEPALLAAGRHADDLPEEIDYRIHFQGMTTGVARALRRSSRWRGERTTAAMAHVFLTLHGLSRRRAGNRSSSIMVVDDGRCRTWADGRSVFGMTAGFAAMMAAHAIGQRESIEPGVHTMSPALMPPADACAALGGLGIRIGVQ